MLGAKNLWTTFLLFISFSTLEYSPHTNIIYIYIYTYIKINVYIYRERICYKHSLYKNNVLASKIVYNSISTFATAIIGDKKIVE